MSYYIPSHKIDPYSLPDDVLFSYMVPPKDFPHVQSVLNYANDSFPFGVIRTNRPLTAHECKAYVMKPLKVEASL